DVFDNSGNAVQVLAAGNTITGNGIGFLDTSVVGNAFNGIVLGADGNTVSGNRIAAMDDDGIDVISGDGNTISGNQIGSSNAGVDWGNTSAGVRVRAAASNT